ncbi:MAG: fumarylacetoacetate hydrolase family protein [Myxococcales bacterium]|jgi:2-keto-4-pentenoate hydratase/2-oxohepta-3-ene-1,7-dioic acid hydratase in catechol pathway
MDVRLANREGRAQLLVDGRCVDVAERSAGRFGPDPMAVLADWERFCEWAAGQVARGDESAVRGEELGPPVPRPGQVFGIGLNYRQHAREAGLPIPERPMVFTKFPSCIAGPNATIPLTGDAVDFEVELVVVIGAGGRDIDAASALQHVAGYMVGQDISDRRKQFADSPPQFSLGKSSAGFGPTGPALVARDGVGDPGALGLRCDVEGERMQDGHTGDLIFPVPELIAYLSAHCELRPGDLIFTGTPSGVGSMRSPARFLKPGDRIVSEIDGLGRLENVCR